MEVCSRILGRDNEVVVHWAPAHHGATGSESADERAKAAAKGKAPSDEVPDEYRWETSLSHMSREASQTRPRATAQWISNHVRPERGYRGPRVETSDGSSFVA